MLATVLGKAGLITNNWTKYHVIAIPGSMALWIVFVAVYAYVAPKLDISTEYDGLVPKLFSSPVFYLQLVVLPAICLLRDFAWKYAKRMYRPQTYHHIQEIQKYNIQDYRPRYVAFSLCMYSIWSVLLTRLFRQDGTIPKGHQEGASGTENAEAAWICIFASRRESDARDQRVRYHEEPWPAWRVAHGSREIDDDNVHVYENYGLAVLVAGFDKLMNRRIENYSALFRASIFGVSGWAPFCNYILA